METDLFGNPDSPNTTKNAAAEAAKATRKAAPKDQASPLAERLRPKTIDEVVGQKHLLGPGKPLRSAFENAHPHSMILWGPPGVGKTTLARLMADAFGLPFISISAVLGGVKDIRDAVEKATANREKTGRSTVVFVDEVHRFSKSQQDAFLPHVESGLFTFIGATTENPSFEVISALLSRSTVYVLESLKEEDLEELLHRALEREYLGLKVNEEAEKILIGLADGDARRFLNALEVSATMAKDRGIKVIDEKFVRAALPATIRRFDKGGDNFYDQISALHKSVRGSDPDAALYWMCRMLDGGVDPLYIARRLMRMSIEDIGLADPRGMEMDLGNDAIRAATIAFENLGKVVANANQWLDKEDFNYEKRASLYGEIINQADEYVKHVLQQVGGIYLNDSYQGDSYPSYQPVSKELQRRSYQWMMEAISQMNWLDNRELLNHCALTGSAADYSQKFFANLLLIQLNNLWLSESKSSDPYTQQQAVEDLKNHLFKETRAGKEPDDWKRFLQGQLLSFVISWSNVNVPKGKDETANASSKLTIQTVCPYRGMTAIESIPYSSAPERAPFWYGCLLDLKSEFTRAKSVAPNREMQEEYDYRLFTIEKALRK